MNNILPFKFSEQLVRIVQNADEYHFVAMDVAAVLGYSDTEALTRRLDSDEKQNLQIVGFGPRGATVISESGLYSAILGSAKPEAKPFKRWVTHEVLPSIRKTGGYQMHSTPVDQSKLNGALAIGECYVRLLRPAASSQIAMLTKIAEDHGISASFLPSYVVDAAPDAAGGSSMVTKSLTALLREHKIPTATPVYNMLLVQLGFLRPMTRASKSAPNGQKEFYAITESGLRFGKNITSPKNSREVSPHWYCDRFLELHALVDEQRDRLRSMGEAA